MMNIDRHNYEEYFILYMDNELNSDDRMLVEDFVQKHPDLKEELDILLQYKLTPDTDIVFEGKEKLMHGEYSPVSMANYEEWFVLYVDNELNVGQRQDVEQFIAEHPSLKEEFALMQRTHLQPEKIIFPAKESLYKRRTAVISIGWRRIAAAAIFLFAIGTTVFITLNKKSSVDPVIAVKPINNQPKIQQAQVAQNDNKKKEAIPIIGNPIASARQADKKKVQGSDVINKKQQNITPVKKEDPIIVNNQQPSNNLPQPIKNPNIKNDVAIAEIPQTNISNKINSSQSSLTNKVVTNNSPQPSNVVYNPDENINQPDAKKGKLRGFLRKLTRTFEKTTKIDPTDNEDRVLIGGLALKLK